MDVNEGCDEFGDHINSFSDSDKQKVINTIFRTCDVNQSGEISVKHVWEYVVMEAKKYNMMIHFDFDNLHDVLIRYSKDGIISETMFSEAMDIWLDNMLINGNNSGAIHHCFIQDNPDTSSPNIEVGQMNNNIGNNFTPGRLSLVSSRSVGHQFSSNSHLNKSNDSNSMGCTNEDDVSPCLIKNLTIVDNSSSLCERCRQYEQHVGELRKIIEQNEECNMNLQSEIVSLQTNLQMQETKQDQLNRVAKRNKDLIESSESKVASYLNIVDKNKKLEIETEKLRQSCVKLQRQIQDLDCKLQSKEGLEHNLQVLLRAEKKEGVKLRAINRTNCEENAHLRETVEILRLNVQEIKNDKCELESTLATLQSEELLKRDTSSMFSSLPTHLGDESDISHFIVESQMYFAAETAKTCLQSSLQDELEVCTVSRYQMKLPHFKDPPPCTPTISSSLNLSVSSVPDSSHHCRNNLVMKGEDSDFPTSQFTTVDFRPSSTNMVTPIVSSHQLKLPHFKDPLPCTNIRSSPNSSVSFVPDSSVIDPSDHADIPQGWISVLLNFVANGARVTCRCVGYLLLILLLLLGMLMVLIVAYSSRTLIPVGCQPSSNIPWAWMTLEEVLGPFITLRYDRPPPV